MKNQIEKAIAAHAAWKQRLEGAIETGKIDIPVATIKVDNECAFGKWLYGDGASAAAKHAARYGKVKDLHAQFHVAAGQVAELATAGKKSEASQVMNAGYQVASTALNKEMTAWGGEIS
jgi:hypothetical protein